MNNLTRVIGLAPSELSPQAFSLRLRKERERVLREIELFRSRVGAKAGKTKAKKLSPVEQALFDAGLSGADLQRMLIAKVKEKESALPTKEGRKDD